jgi:uncharacterized protein
VPTRITLPDEGDIAEGDSALLVVDAPNVDAVHGGMLGRQPRRSERFDPAALTSWAEAQVDGGLQRTLFTNVADPPPPGVEGWIKALVEQGWRVYARPRLQVGDDVDEAMVQHLRSRPWREIIVFSHDSACFSEPLLQLRREGAAVTVIGFRECAGRLPHLDGVDFVDAEDVPGLYRSAPARVRLDALPAVGGWVTRAV